MYHLWFVYMIIGVYLTIPIIYPVYCFVKQRPEFQLYLLILWITISSITIYQSVPVLALLQQTQLMGYGGYFLLGGIIANTKSLRQIRTKYWIYIYILASMLTFALTWHFSERARTAVETPFNYTTPNVFIASVAVFLILFRMTFVGCSFKIISWASDHVFIVFFVHVIILERVQIAFAPAGMPTALEIFASSSATFVICLAIAAALRWIPKSRVVLG